MGLRTSIYHLKAKHNLVLKTLSDKKVLIYDE